jgi:hypothetical protein
MLIWVARRFDLLTVHCVVMPAVLELFSYAATDFKVKIRRHCHILSIGAQV